MMPSDTFFRIPEEKRTRLLEAAWTEFTRSRYSDVSINKIICRARIPRGSFYQYFEDKEDLFRYLLEDVKKSLLFRISAVLDQSGRDIFDFSLLAFDELMKQESMARPELRRCVDVFRLNPGLVPQLFIVDKSGPIWDAFLSRADLSQFRSTREEFLEEAFRLLVSTLGAAIMDTLTWPERRQEHRKTLQIRLDIIRAGCLLPSAGGEA